MSCIKKIAYDCEVPVALRISSISRSAVFNVTTSIMCKDPEARVVLYAFM
jgi:hypothetical protein